MHIPPELQDWLKTSIGGIILLGAIGSLLAVLVGRLLIEIRRRVLPAPYYAHMKRKERLAYFLGFTHATIEADKTGRALTTFLAFRASRLLFALVLFLFSAVLASNVLVFQAQVALTVGLFLSIVAAFLALYWAHFEFEYIYRTYLWVWKKPMGAADTGYKKYTDSKIGGANPPRKGRDSPAG